MTDQQIKHISVEELKDLMDKNDNICLIDVREQHEWDDGHIKNAIHVPLNDVLSKIESISKDLDEPLYLQCRSGVRSQNAAAYLLQLGYKNVYSVDGGILSWQNCNYPIVN